MFAEFPDTHFGLNFDPSHLVWQHIDPRGRSASSARGFVHVHAKDVRIDREGLYEDGICRPRLARAEAARAWATWTGGRSSPRSTDAGYDGPVCIEVEDRAYEGSDERVKAGFLLARDAVKAWVV